MRRHAFDFFSFFQKSKISQELKTCIGHPEREKEKEKEKIEILEIFNFFNYTFVFGILIFDIFPNYWIRR